MGIFPNIYNTLCVLFFAMYALIPCVVGKEDALRHPIKFESECGIEFTDFFPYLVGIECLGQGIDRQGALLSSKVLVTTCGWFHQPIRRCRAVTVKVDPRNKIPYCAQYHDLLRYIKHPKCRFRHFDTLGRLFNVALVVLKEAIYDSDYKTPVMPLSTTPWELLSVIRFANRGNDTSFDFSSNCIIPRFTVLADLEKDNWGVPEYYKYFVIPVLSACVIDYCGGTGRLGHQKFKEPKERCIKNLINNGSDMFLCLAPKERREYPAYAKFYVGAPVVCEGVGVGIVSEVTKRWSGAQEFLFVHTFMRMWTWFRTMIARFSLKGHYYSDIETIFLTSSIAASTKFAKLFYFIYPSLILLFLRPYNFNVR